MTRLFLSLLGFSVTLLAEAAYALPSVSSRLFQPSTFSSNLQVSDCWPDFLQPRANSVHTAHPRRVARAIVSLTGTVFEDVNYGGGAGRSLAASSGSPRPGATVELYDDAGAFLAATTTAANGQYTFTVSEGSYVVRAVSSTVSSSRPGYVAGLLPVLTYVNGDSNRVGGEAPEKTDASVNTGRQPLTALTTVSTTAQNVATVVADAAGASGIDFGFNFDVVCNINDAGQGSLRQFILNANVLTNTNLDQAGLTPGKETTVFMIPNGATTGAPAGLRTGLVSGLTAGGVAIISPITVLPPLQDANTLISGLTQTTNVGNTNTAVLGTGGMVGANATPLSQVNGPEVQLTGNSGLSIGLDVAGANSGVMGVAIHGFGSVLDSQNHGNIRLRGNDVTVSQSVIGTTAINFSMLSAGRTNADGITVSAGTRAIISNNLIGYMSGTGINVRGGIRRTQINNNEISFNAIGLQRLDGVDNQGNTTTISGNLFSNNAGGGIDSFTSSGGNTYINNTVTSNGRGGGETSGIRVYGVNNTVSSNAIYANFGAGITVVSSSSTTLVSRNTIYNNGTITSNTGGAATNQIGIDLLSSTDNQGFGSAPYITKNDPGDVDAGGNGQLNFPVLASATLVGAKLTVTGYVQAGATIELFLATPDPLGFGEGETYLLTIVEGSAQDTDAGVGSYGPGRINGLFQGQDNTNRFSFEVPLASLPSAQQAALNAGGTQLTATATLAGATSEFSGNVKIGVPLTGTVFEDVNYGGGAGRSLAASSGSPRPGATVELYDDAGAFLAVTTTDADGRYEFNAAPDLYTVRVVSSTVSSSRPGFRSGLVPVPTFNGTTDQIGGADPARADAPANSGSQSLTSLTTASTTAQAVATVMVGTSPVAGPDFGFNFDVIVNTNDAGQGSLRQFILNSNSLGGEAALAQSGSTAASPLPAGRETSIFMIPSGQAVPGLRAAASGGPASQLTAGVAVILVPNLAFFNNLPNVVGSFTSLDGGTQSANIGQTNGGGNVKYRGGSTAAVGVGPDGVAGSGDELQLRGVDAPEVQVQGPGIAGANVATGLTIQADDVTVRGLALVGFREQDLYSIQLAAGTSVDRLLVENNVFGAGASELADPGGSARSFRGIALASLSSSTTIRNNVFAFEQEKAINMTTGTTQQGLLIEGNEFHNCGLGTGAASNEAISLRDGYSDVTVQRNLFDKSAVAGATADQYIEVNYSATGSGVGTLRIEENSLIGSLGRGISFLQSANANSTGKTAFVRHNIIRNSRNGDGVLQSTNANVVITQNSIFNNGSSASADNRLGIRFSSNGVTLNDPNDADTGPNGLLNYPVLTAASIIGSDLVVQGFARPGVVVELFGAAPDPSGFGEGQTYLVSRTEGSADDVDTGTGSYGPGAVNGLIQGRDNTNRFAFSIPLASLSAKQQAALAVCEMQLTATATTGSVTSEFSGNVLLNTAPVTIRASGGPTVCAGETVRLSAAPRPGFLYTWYDGATIVNGSGALPDDSVLVVQATGSYMVQITPPNCPAVRATSSVVAVTVLPALTAGSIDASQTVCSGAAPAPLTSTADAGGGTGTYGYQWEISTNNTTWTDVPSATNPAYAPGLVTTTTYFRRRVTSGTCAPEYTAVVTLSVLPPLTPGNIGSSQTVCAGEPLAPLASTAAATGGTGTYAYQWEASADNISWADVAGATSASYAPAPVAGTTYFRRKVVSGTGGCATATSNVVTLTVLPTLTAGSIGADQTVCANTAPAQLTSTAGASGGTGTFSYQWEASGNTTTWTAISGATGPTYSPGPLTTTTYFRRQVTSGTGSCATATSNSVKITVQPAPVASVTLAAPPAQCAGSALTFTPTPTNGGPTPTFRWFVNNALLATGSTFTSSTLVNNDQVRVEMTPTPNSCITGTPTATVTVRLTPVVVPTLRIRVQGAGGAICTGTMLNFGVESATGTGTAPEYQWLLNGTAVPGSTTPTFSSAALRDGDRLRLQLRSSETCASPAVLLSNELVVSVQPNTPPAVTIAGSGAACTGQPVRFAIASASNLGSAPTYQWQIDGVDVTGAHSSTYSSTALRDGQVVTLVVRTVTACGPAATVSNAVRTTITPPVDVEAGPDKEILEGEEVTLEGTANGSYPVEWLPAQSLRFTGANRLRPVASPVVTTVYTLRASLNGCQDESKVTVKVGPPIRIPSAFSPNGDGTNDTWEIDRIGLFPNNTVTIFNRWGNKVYSTSNYGRANEWGGRINGAAAPIGTYYYRIDLGNGRTFSGPVSIVY